MKPGDIRYCVRCGEKMVGERRRRDEFGIFLGNTFYPNEAFDEKTGDQLYTVRFECPRYRIVRSFLGIRWNATDDAHDNYNINI